jgi:uncharacterized protein (TIGR02284 family)
MNTMTQSVQEVISTLNHLAEVCRDGQEGFAAAANGIKNSDLKKLFKTYSRQRGQFAEDLRSEVHRLGGALDKPDKKESRAAGSHKAWVTLKSLPPNEDESVVIAECQRGEAFAIKAYEEALTSGLPEELQTLVRHQYLQVEESYDLIRALEKATK